MVIEAHCPKCQFVLQNAEVPDLCPKCGFAIKRAQKMTSSKSPTPLLPPLLRSEGSRFVRPSRRSRFLLIVISVLAIQGYKTLRQVRRPASSAPMEILKGPCLGKKRCVVAYVAPWCPACEDSIPVIQEMGLRWNNPKVNSDRGIKVLVGADREAKCRQKAEKIGPFAGTDEYGDFAKAYGVTGYPTWIIFDEKGVEVKRTSGGYGRPEQVDVIAETEFGI